MLISLELVPRDYEGLAEDLDIAKGFAQVNTINVPDLLRFSIRSWEACGFLYEKSVLPHIVHVRAIDFSLEEPFPYAAFFQEKQIKAALVIAGDPPLPGSNKKVYPTDTIPFIKKLKREMPGLKIYAAFDPYRSNIRYEIDYLKAKEDAGAEGFMSQPFFDTRLLEIYAEYLEHKNVYWGLAPVLTEASRAYWESRNRAVFPKHFVPTLQWNIEFERKVLNFCKAGHFNAYLMPILVDLKAYLEGLFTSAEKV